MKFTKKTKRNVGLLTAVTVVSIVVILILNSVYHFMPISLYGVPSEDRYFVTSHPLSAFNRLGVRYYGFSKTVPIVDNVEMSIVSFNSPSGDSSVSVEIGSGWTDSSGSFYLDGGAIVVSTTLVYPPGTVNNYYDVSTSFNINTFYHGNGRYMSFCVNMTSSGGSKWDGIFSSDENFIDNFYGVWSVNLRFYTKSATVTGYKSAGVIQTFSTASKVTLSGTPYAVAYKPFPEAKFTWSPSPVRQNVPITFNAATSTANRDNSPGDTIVRYAWYIRLQGQPPGTPYNTTSSSYVYPGFSTIAMYTVTLVVRNNWGLEHSVSWPISVGSPPIAPVLTVTGDTTGTTPATKTYTVAVTQIDPGATIVIYDWYCNNVKESAQHAQPDNSHTWSWSYQGSYTVACKGTDSNGLKSWGNNITCVVTIPIQYYYLTTSVSPSGYGTVNPSGTNIQYVSGTLVSVTAVANTNYKFDRWRLDAVDAGTTSPLSVTMTANHNVVANFILDNKAPTARLTSPSNGTSWRVGSAVPFDGSQSSDPEGSVLSYTWNFGDGSTNLTTQKTPIHRFLTVATERTISLQVTDAGGKTSTITRVIIAITVDNKPVAKIGGLGTGIVGQSISFSGFDSSDDGLITELRFSWDDGKPSTSAYPPQSYTASHIWDVEGTYYVQLVAYDNAYPNPQVSNPLTDGSILPVTISGTGYTVEAAVGNSMQIPSNTPNLVLRFRIFDVNRNPVSGKTITMEVVPGATTLVYPTYSSTASDGNGYANITIVGGQLPLCYDPVTRIKLSPYVVKFNIEGKLCWSTYLSVFPPLMGTIDSSVKFAQSYDVLNKDYDLKIRGVVYDGELGTSSTVSDAGIMVKFILPGSIQLPGNYWSAPSSGSTFVIQAKIYLYYSGQTNPLASRSVSVVYSFTKTGYYSIEQTVIITMIAPTVQITVNLSPIIGVGTRAWTITFKDLNGKEYSTLTKENIIITIKDKQTNQTWSSARDFEFHWSSGIAIVTVDFTFDKTGYYLVQVEIVGLSVTQDPKTIDVEVRSSIIDPLSLLSNMYVIGGIAAGVIIAVIVLALKRRSPSQTRPSEVRTAWQ